MAGREPGQDMWLASVGNRIEEGHPNLALLPGHPVAALASARAGGGDMNNGR
jgi:hypothetical protein